MKKHNLIGVSGKAQSGKDTVGKIIQYLISQAEAIKNLDMPDREYWIRLNFQEYCNHQMNFSNWKIKKFAYKVKQILSLLTGIPVEDFEKEEVKNSYLGEEWRYYEDGVKQYYTIRSLLQKVGTDAMRDVIHPDVWVNALMKDYKAVDRRTWQDPDDSNITYPNWIITDCRFPNEAKAIKDRGGIIIRVNRDYYKFDKKVHEWYNNKDILLSTKHAIFNPELYTKEESYKEYISKYNEGEHESETALDDYNFDYVVENDSSIEDLIEKVKVFLTKYELI